MCDIERARRLTSIFGTRNPPAMKERSMEMKAHDPSPEQAVTHEVSADHHGVVQTRLSGTMTGVAYRYDAWPSLHGEVSFGFNAGPIQAGSHVFVSVSECDNGGNRFMGSAIYTVQNIVVKPGRTEFRINIGWNSPLRVSTDILVINP
jgi:hypothetical protein